jgi:hypothetical protein
MCSRIDNGTAKVATPAMPVTNIGLGISFSSFLIVVSFSPFFPKQLATLHFSPAPSRPSAKAETSLALVVLLDDCARRAGCDELSFIIDPGVNDLLSGGGIIAREPFHSCQLMKPGAIRDIQCSRFD